MYGDCHGAYGVYWKPIFNLLEGDFTVLRPIPSTSNKCLETSAWAQDGCEGLPIDCRTLGAWTPTGEFYPVHRDS